MTKEKILKQLSDKFSKEELEKFLKIEFPEEKKLSYYGYQLMEAAKKAMPYTRHSQVANELYRAIKSYGIAAKIYRLMD